MTARGRIFATTAFKLSAIYLAVFSAFAIAFVLYVSYATNQLLDRQLRDTIDAEIRGLAEQGRTGGLAALVRGVENRAGRPGSSLYLVTDAAGRIIAGNVSEVPSDLLMQAGGEPVTLPYERDEAAGEVRQAMVQVVALPGGLRMLVGRDIAERERFREIVARALGLAVLLLLVLGLVSWLFVSRRVLKRIDAMSATSRRIMAGDLGGRLDLAGNGDEFDRLAAGLNAMLDRIEQLLYSFKDVSDNIAHDLKTPLTRLRNRVEAVLAGPPDAARYRAALETTIEESDQLIRTFNALLMIARAEAGSPDGATAEIDAAEIVHDVVELYEPVAEEAGVALTVAAAEPVRLRASRELLGQALANLIDNAIKYGRRPDGEGGRVSVACRREGDELMLIVEDDGPGVPPADRERVLQRFVRLEKSRSAPGSGLGLSLVAAVVRLHHGTIALEDRGPGLAVVLRLPLAGAA